jgi:hypothetical protein
VDGFGHVVWLNQTGASLLGTDRVPAVTTDAEALFGLGLENLFSLAHLGRPMPRQCPNGLTLWMQARPEGNPQVDGHSDSDSLPPLHGSPAAEAGPEALEPIEPIDDLAAPTLHLASRTLIESTLASCGGNVSRAARQLGVSRGLLYRRLGEWRSGEPAAR